jgi:hypothetical protein
LTDAVFAVKLNFDAEVMLGMVAPFRNNTMPIASDHSHCSFGIQDASCIADPDTEPF